jgi:TetR/AcrR family transcriptional regulator, transcriptional repressor for nem operon
MSRAAAGTQDAKAPGRPREFELNDALDRAVDVFRELGYEATSMAILEQSTGLNKSSIYNTFGSKENLFRLALHRYETLRLSAIRETLASGIRGLDDLHQALDLQRAEIDSPWGANGCLAVNAMTELGQRGNEINGGGGEFRQAFAELLRLPLDRAVALGEIDPATIPHSVALLVSLTLGVGVLMRCSASAAELDRHFEAAHRAVESWRIAGHGRSPQ